MARVSELTHLNLLCYFIFLSRKPVFVALPKGLCCSLCCVSRETHIIFDMYNFLRLSAFSSGPPRLKGLVFCLVVEGETIWQVNFLKSIFRRH